MQFNVMPRTGGLAINRENRGKRGVRRHNSHTWSIMSKSAMENLPKKTHPPPEE